ncbi:MAG: imidazole glycerol phosphate synthase subunit HisH [Porticoccaceae bacterium]|nr:MAG: imidazole glycerol phosphate synthase subunit HisH [Porticoccaceae bacterium]
MTDFRLRVAVIDCGLGNLHSVHKALAAVASRAEVVVTGDPAQIAAADRVVFPGVGAIRDCMACIRAGGFGEVVRKAIAEKPVLGICLGLQALFAHSEENGGVAGLGILPGEVRRFRAPPGERLKVPHMGWNRVHRTRDHPMWRGIDQDEYFYFVHSYHAVTEPEWVAATCRHGVEFPAAVAQGNLFAVQFHPEKSQRAGLQLLKNFIQWRGE